MVDARVATQEPADTTDETTVVLPKGGQREIGGDPTCRFALMR